MNCSECIGRLHDYVDADSSPADRAAIERHLAQCPDCRAQLESLQELLADARALPREISPPRDLWSGIESRIAPHENRSAPLKATAVERTLRGGPRANSSPPRHSILRWAAPFAVAASVAFFAAFSERTLVRRTPGWSVAAVSGAPRVGSQAVQNEGTFRVGQWLETDASSRARVTVGSIGEVSVEPNSRLRLVAAAATDHRLELARGELSAFILAPPRLFFVDTPSATAVDLGCAYTLNVDDDGNGELHVTSGYVALENGGRESIIRMGMMCLMRRGHGPGTPFAEDAPESLRIALARFDFEPGAATAVLSDVLDQARPEDAVTLWHLLLRTGPGNRGAVFDVLARYKPPPAAVTRAGIVAGSPAMLRAWAAELGLDRL